MVHDVQMELPARIAFNPLTLRRSPRIYDTDPRPSLMWFTGNAR